MRGENALIVLCAAAVVSLGVLFPHYFALAILLGTFWLSFSLEFRRLVHDQEFFAGGVEFLKGKFFAFFYAGVSAFVRAIIAAFAALFLFPFTGTINCDGAPLFGRFRGECGTDVEIASMSAEGITIAALLFATILFVAFVSLAMKKGVGKYHERWSYFRFALPYGFLYSASYVTLSHAGIIERPGKQFIKNFSDFVSGKVVDIETALLAISQFEKLTTAFHLVIGSAIANFAESAFKVPPLLSSIMMFVAEFLISANVFVGYVIVTIAVFLVRLNSSYLVTPRGNISDTTSAVLRVRLFLEPAENFKFSTDTHEVGT